MNPITREEAILAGEDLKPITRMEMFLKKFAGGGSGGNAVQPDLSQNDPEAADYVKNRTHWLEEIIEYVYEENTKTIGSDCWVQLASFVTLNVGETYFVNFNGTEYECVAWLSDNELQVILGNGAILGGSGGNNEPFSCNCNIDTHRLFLSVAEPGDYTISIGKSAVKYNTIDEAYLPECAKVVRPGTGPCSVIFNPDNVASDGFAVAEGCFTQALGLCSHSEGGGTRAEGERSHAEGGNTIAGGSYSHAEGYYTTASGNNQHVQGKYNINDVDTDGNALNTYAHIVGNGTSHDTRSNAHTLDWDGNGWFAGGLKVGGTGQDDTAASAVPAVSTASVGQTIVVKAVDDTGKPTEWEAVDLPSGGSGGADEPTYIYVQLDGSKRIACDADGNQYTREQLLNVHNVRIVDTSISSGNSYYLPTFRKEDELAVKFEYWLMNGTTPTNYIVSNNYTIPVVT